MALPFRIPKSFSDITRNFEYLANRVDVVKSGFISCSPNSPATTDTMVATVTHDAGFDPTAIQLTVLGGSYPNTLTPYANKLDANRFEVRVVSDVAIETVVGLSWTVLRS